MSKYEMNKLDRMMSPIGRYLVTGILILLILGAAFVLLVFKTNKILDVDNKVAESNYLRTKPVTTNVDVVKQFLAVGDGEAEPIIGTGSSSAEGFDQQVCDKLKAGGYSEDKAIAMTYAWCAFSEKYGKEFAIGVMANVNAEGTLGAVEQKFSISHAHGFSLPSGKSVVQSAADVEYLKAWDSTSTVRDKGVQKGSCGFGISQMSFDRRVRLCAVYLKTVTDYKSVDQMASAEIKYIDSEIADGGNFDHVPKACVGKSPEECASIVCEKFEIPNHLAAQKVIRAGYASNIKKIMGVS